MSSQGSSSSSSSQGRMLNSRPTTSSRDWPALNEGEFKTDNFRMYNFKVYPCRRTYVHVWSQCPFYHPGENARRRNPRMYQYSPLQCQSFRSTGACTRGDDCEFAHGIFETWLHPAQYRTRICRDTDQCTRPLCFFAHNHHELRPIYTKTGCAEPEFPNSTATARAQPIMTSSTRDEQNHLLSNIRMLQNIKLNSGLGLEDNIPGRMAGAMTESSDSFIGCGPFFDYNDF